MAQLYFRYGAMNASKSIQLLTVAHNYEQSGKKVMVFTPAIDDRYGVGKVASRVGISREAIPVIEDTDLFTHCRSGSKEAGLCIGGRGTVFEQAACYAIGEHRGQAAYSCDCVRPVERL